MPQTQMSTVQSERINLRISPVAKRQIEQAASVEGKTVSAFIVASALEKAENAIDRHEIRVLAREDAMQFFHALNNPPSPNDQLQGALDEHGQRIHSR